MKSPVWITTPMGVVMAMPIASGMEWQTRKNSMRNLPSVKGTCGSTTWSSAALSLPRSRSLTLMRAVREAGGIDGDVQFGQDERERADVVFVAVRD